MVRSRESHIYCFYLQTPLESYRNEKLDVSDWGAENEDPDSDDEGEDSDESDEEEAQ